MVYNTSDTKVDKDRNMISGLTTTNTVNGEITGFTLTVFDTGVKEQMGIVAMLPGGDYLLPGQFTEQDVIGANGTHEAKHVTDPKSKSFTNPGATRDEIEKAPDKAEAEFYQEVKKKNEQKKNN